ncbi:hypothetical protein BJ546DRAFT_109894 [Cryomyces antarcticus]
MQQWKVVIPTYREYSKSRRLPATWQHLCTRGAAVREALRRALLVSCLFPMLHAVAMKLRCAGFLRSSTLLCCFCCRLPVPLGARELRASIVVPLASAAGCLLKPIGCSVGNTLLLVLLVLLVLLIVANLCTVLSSAQSPDLPSTVSRRDGRVI